jgi:hypothetical protein
MEIWTVICTDGSMVVSVVSWLDEAAARADWKDALADGMDAILYHGNPGEETCVAE